MSDADVNNVVRAVESGRSQGHDHNFNDAYARIVQMQNSDGGANSAQFNRDMTQVNQKLHQEGLITNLQIVGVEYCEP